MPPLKTQTLIHTTAEVGLGLKQELKKRDAEQKLRVYIAQVVGQSSAKPDESVTLGWFWENRFLPLQTRWRDSTRIVLEVVIKKHLLGRFGNTRLCDLKRFELQTHLNALANQFSKSLVKKIKTWTRAILAEAVEQECI
jgi:Phage integrase, N-terminal SAM-like domain